MDQIDGIVEFVNSINENEGSQVYTDDEGQHFFYCIYATKGGSIAQIGVRAEPMGGSAIEYMSERVKSDLVARLQKSYEKTEEDQE